ncbi:DUF934 domain-containing protein [Oceanobacter mangrovi]|uniref:DUF934 domain-containing protein n=1 Tax=Oceanobacter mangrovi TaxID=2862510 RepID=UPI001C8DF4F4|nr:DUF934 domain-containing protein [Oceanobacter mangrovi]
MSQLIAIRNGVAEQVFDDPWYVPASNQQTQVLKVEDYRQWLAEQAGTSSSLVPALQLSAADEPEELVELLQQAPMVALNFEKFTDGRAYSQAAVLRRNLGYQGDIRAVGDVLRDQLVLMQQCGFSSFLIRADKNAEQALQGLQRFRYGFAR